MNEGEYQLAIDESGENVSFNTTSLSGASAGLADIKQRRKIIALRRRSRLAQLRLDRSAYTGMREVTRWGGGGLYRGVFGGLVNVVLSWRRFKAYDKTAATDVEIAHIDRLLITIDRVIIDLEAKIKQMKKG